MDSALAQEAARSPRIYSCLDAQGKRITSDRPIPECLAREQKLHGVDGTVRGVLPPSTTAQERAVIDAERRRKEDERAAAMESLRRDRALLGRYPNEASHEAQRDLALADVQRSLENTKKTLDLLAQERKGLMQEADFYKGGNLPAKLKQRIESNQAQTDASISGRQRQLADVDRIQAMLSIELERLRRLWAGAPPGSLGPLPTLPTASDAPAGAASASESEPAKAKGSAK